VPVVVALLAWGGLGERLSSGQMAGLLLTLASVAAVVWQRRPGAAPDADGTRSRGIVCAALAAFFQALGLVVARAGVTSGIDNSAATLLRIAPSALLLTLACRSGAALAVAGGGTAAAHRRPEARQVIGLACAVLLGTVLSTALQTYALQHTRAAICAVLGATYPLWMILLGRALGARIDRAAVLPTAGAVVGVGLVMGLSG
jgi:drug/metabolite transporter (DMT)-like permease